MSRIGKKPIEITDGVQVSLDKGIIKAKGPKGELQLNISSALDYQIESQIINLRAKNDKKLTRSLHGLHQRLVSNMIEGVSQGFSKKLEYKGVGYKALVTGNKLILNVGFSHPVEITAKSGIEFKVEKTFIIVSGIDKQMVGEMAAQIRKVRPPEPYKGKGIRYFGEYVKIKPGKAAKTAAS